MIPKRPQSQKQYKEWPFLRRIWEKEDYKDYKRICEQTHLDFWNNCNRSSTVELLGNYYNC